MAQLATAQFITASWFATGLTPTVTINEAASGTLIGTFNMTETSAGNYVYDFTNSDDKLVYFFKYDSWSATTLNRYMGNNNKIETAVVASGWGGAIITNNGMTKKEMEKLVQMILEVIPEQKEIVLDTSKIEDKLVLIDKKIDDKDIEFDYGLILNNNDKNTEKVINKISWIVIPKYDDKNVMSAIKAIDLSPLEQSLSNIYRKFDNIEVDRNTLKTEKQKREKAIDNIKKFKEQLKQMEADIEDENITEAEIIVIKDKMDAIEDIAMGMINNNEKKKDKGSNIFNSLLKN